MGEVTVVDPNSKKTPHVDLPKSERDALYRLEHGMKDWPDEVIAHPKTLRKR
jgi:hypothetical protein